MMERNDPKSTPKVICHGWRYWPPSIGLLASSLYLNRRGGKFETKEPPYHAEDQDRQSMHGATSFDVLQRLENSLACQAMICYQAQSSPSAVLASNYRDDELGSLCK